MNMLRKIWTEDDFKRVTGKIRKFRGYREPQAFGLGLVHVGNSGRILSVRFPTTNYKENPGSASVFRHAARQCKMMSDSESSRTYLLDADAIHTIERAFHPYQGDTKKHCNIRARLELQAMAKVPCIDGRYHVGAVFVYDLMRAATSAADAYLRLHLLSMGKIPPNDLELKGMAPQLTKCAWTNKGAVEMARFDEVNHEHILGYGESLRVESIHELPSLLDFVVSPTISVLDRNMRLGAHPSPSTMILPKELEW